MEIYKATIYRSLKSEYNADYILKEKSKMSVGGIEAEDS